ncbi:MAG: TPM domain-containing protein [bacterium]|nr:TPM domain-containing protein [bacterium]
MKYFCKFTLLIIPLLAMSVFFASSSFGETVSSLGKAKGYVNDFANVLSSGDESRLNSICENLVAANSTELAIVTIRTTDGRPIEEFAVELFNNWGIGNAQADNGLLILAAIDDHDYFVATGYGIEDAIPDSLAVRIMENEAVPEFRNGSYGTGLINAATEYSAVLSGEDYKSGSSFNPGLIVILGAFFVPLALFGILFLLIGIAIRIKCPRCGSRVKMLDNKEVLEADYSHSGIRKKDFECTVCHHQFSKMKIIPMLVQASGSSGGSSGWRSGSSSSGGWFSSGGGSSFGGFSGGSSGGGGGGGHW